MLCMLCNLLCMIACLQAQQKASAAKRRQHTSNARSQSASAIATQDTRMAPRSAQHKADNEDKVAGIRDAIDGA